MTSRWSGNGPIYEVDWGGKPWRLDLEAAQPGLLNPTSSQGPLLAFHSLSDWRRQDDNAFGAKALSAFETRFDFVEALYVPAGWHSLRVRARWTAARSDTSIIDLEVQLQADTVDELKGVRAQIISVTGSHTGANPIVAVSGSSYYLEMSHPDDTASRDLDRPESIETSLFGHDLERGVVLRGRVRGVWIDTPPNSSTTARVYSEFLNAPLPLGP